MSRRHTLYCIEDSRNQIKRAPLFPETIEGKWRWNVRMIEVEGGLLTGDFALAEWTGRDNERAGVCVEWKRNWRELEGNLSGEDAAGRDKRDRFKRELARMLLFERRIIIVCEPWSALGDVRGRQSLWNADSLLENLRAIQEAGVCVEACDGEKAGALYCLDVIRRFAEKKREAGWLPRPMDERAAEAAPEL